MDIFDEMFNKTPKEKFIEIIQNGNLGALEKVFENFFADHIAMIELLEKQGFRVTYLNVDEKGFIDLKELENSICEDTILISIMFANNEIRYNRADKTNW